MTAERWARIKEVFSAASDRPEQERAAFLDSACAADDLLRAEVERLLAQDEETLKGPAATLLAQATPELSAGQLLSHYRVEAKVGGGSSSLWQSGPARNGHAEGIGGYPAFGLAGAIVGIVIMVALLAFVPCSVALRMTRRTSQPHQAQ